MHFDSFSFHGQIMANIKAQGYTAPTPIQEQAMPHVLEGRDLMGLAQTGTGKTAAFLLPILQRLMKRRGADRKSVRALVVAPTRELGRKTGLRFATVYGGVGMNPQLRALDRGVEIVIACPGRLLDLMSRGAGDFSNLEVLVLDEADHMFDMGFLPDLKKIMSRLPRERQTLLFSATMPSSIRSLAEEALVDPVRVAIKHAAPVETVSHSAYPVPQHLKTRLLLQLLKQRGNGSALVFTRTKHKAKQLAQQLQRAGHKAASLQGNLSQNKRQSTMKAFRDGACTVLVATDIAARGIDVSKVAQVINYDMPDTPETYTHRIGRTGRAERSGQALSLTTRDDASMLRAVERLLGKPMPKHRLDDFDYNVDVPAGGDYSQRPGNGAKPNGGRKSDSRGPRHGAGKQGGDGRRSFGKPPRRDGAKGSRPVRRSADAS